MSKVKQKSPGAGVRNVKSNKKLARRPVKLKAKAGARPKPRAKAVRRQAPKKPKVKAKTSTRPAVSVKPKVMAKPAPISRFAIKPLDPLRKCGAGTSVQFLYRVDESVEGRTTPHLVYFDHHGWYCDHGQTCPAVAQARKFSRA